MESYVFTIGAYLLVLVALAIGVRFVRGSKFINGRLSLGRLGGASSSKEDDPAGLRILNSLAVGTNQWIHVVEFAGKRILIGTTQGSISLISEDSRATISNSNNSELKL